MGLHAEEMAQYFCVSREEQEVSPFQSHPKAHQATQDGKIKEQIIPIENRTVKTRITEDNLIRSSMKKEKLQRMKPVFDRRNGTITATYFFCFDRRCLLCVVDV